MDKKSKPQRRKTPTADELADATPRGASFDTEEGRAAQGMRPDIGSPEAGQPGKDEGEPDEAADGAEKDREKKRDD